MKINLTKKDLLIFPFTRTKHNETKAAEECCWVTTQAAAYQMPVLVCLDVSWTPLYMPTRMLTICTFTSFYSNIVHFIIIIIIIIINIGIIILISCMQGIYTYIPETTMSLGNTLLQLFCCYYSWCLYR